MKTIEQAITHIHNNIRKICNDIGSTTERAVDRRTELLSQLAKEVRVLSISEDRSLYPKLDELEDEEILLLTERSREEQRLFDSLLADLNGADPGDRKWTAQFIILKDLIESHMHRKETRLLRLAEAVLDERQEANILARFNKESSDARMSP